MTGTEKLVYHIRTAYNFEIHCWLKLVLITWMKKKSRFKRLTPVSKTFSKLLNVQEMKKYQYSVYTWMHWKKVVKSLSFPWIEPNKSIFDNGDYFPLHTYTLNCIEAWEKIRSILDGWLFFWGKEIGTCYSEAWNWGRKEEWNFSSSPNL